MANESGSELDAGLEEGPAHEHDNILPCIRTTRSAERAHDKTDVSLCGRCQTAPE